MRKGEIACNEQFLLFSQCFLRYMVFMFHFKCTLKCRLQFVSICTSLNFVCCGVHGREVKRWPCNHEVPSSSPGSGSQLWDFSLAHIFGASTGVVPRKQNRERLV